MIVFSFSKKECEALALQMATLDLNSEDEKQLVSGVFTNALECLSEGDRGCDSTMLVRMKHACGNA